MPTWIYIFSPSWSWIIVARVAGNMNKSCKSLNWRYICELKRGTHCAHDQKNFRYQSISCWKRVRLKTGYTQCQQTITTAPIVSGCKWQVCISLWYLCCAWLNLFRSYVVWLYIIFHILIHSTIQCLVWCFARLFVFCYPPWHPSTPVFPSPWILQLMCSGVNPISWLNYG